jgi:hypothetical protein
MNRATIHLSRIGIVWIHGNCDDPLNAPKTSFFELASALVANRDYPARFGSTLLVPGGLSTILP